MITSKPSKPSLAAGLLLALMAILAGGAARHESVTVDEVAHTAAGVSYLQKLDLRMNAEHPPLAKALAAIPLVLRRARADYSDFSWTFSGKSIFNQFLGEWVFGDYFLLRWNDPHFTLLWARVPMLLITLLLGLALYIFGSQLGGSRWGGLLCLAVFVSYPAFLAFGPLVITDIIVTLFWILAVWQLPRMWQSPNRSQVMKLGLAMAGAFLSKFSSGLLLFVFPAVALSLRLKPLPEQRKDKAELRTWRRRGWRNIFKAILWAALFVYLFYFVFSWNQSTDSFNLIPHFPASHLLRRVLMPIWLYLQGLVLFAVSAGSRPTFILGHAYPHGVWFYFPALFLLKSPFAFLGLLVLTLGVAIVIKSRFPQFSPIPCGMELRWRCLWVSLAIFTSACLLSRLDISIRHFTIPLALIFLLLAPLPRMLQFLDGERRKAARIATYSTFGLAAVSIITAIAVYPNFFPFLNVLSMGKPGYMLMNDSNLDWDHALPEVDQFVNRRGIRHVLVDSYAFTDPQAFVPQAQVWDCQQPHPEDAGHWAVVSAGLIVDGSNCRWLFRYLHRELAGGSMYAFLLPAEIPAAGQPGGPPLPQDFRYFGGTPALNSVDVRTIFYRCISDPQQLQVIMDEFMAMMQKEREKKMNGGVKQ